MKTQTTVTFADNTFLDYVGENSEAHAQALWGSNPEVVCIETRPISPEDAEVALATFAHPTP